MAATTTMPAAASGTAPTTSSGSGQLAVSISGAAQAGVQVRGPNGWNASVKAPAALCGLPPGTYDLSASAPGFTTATSQVTVAAGQASAVSLVMKPVGAIKVDAALASITDADGNPVPNGAAALKPGIYQVDLGLQTLVAPVRAGVVTRIDPALPGILVGQQRLGVPAGLRVRTWLEPGGKRLRGHRHRDERWYDKGPLTTVKELQWKVRAIVVYRGRWTTFKDVWRRMHKPRRRSSRQFLVDPQGVVYQTLDLFDHTFAGGPSIDATTVSIELGVPRGDEPTAAQLDATQKLLEVLSNLLARVTAPFPAGPDQRVPAIRSIRGLMTGRQAGYRHDGKFSLDLKSLSLAARGVPLTGAGTVPLTLPKGTSLGIGVLADVTGATVDAKTTSGESRHGTTPFVSCGTRGTLAVIVTHPNRAPVSRTVTQGVAELTLPALGSISVDGPAAITGTQVLIHGPDGYVAKGKLPWTANDVGVGAYRISIPQADRPPFRWAVRVDEGLVSQLTLPDLSAKKLPSIIIDGHPYPLAADIKVVTHRGRKGYSFYRARRRNPRYAFYGTRKMPDGREVETLADISKVTRSVVLHADVVKDSPATFAVLVARHLSTHFGIDWDGTLYQFLDPKHVAFGASEMNPFAVQIDLNNRLPNLVSDPKATYVPQRHAAAKMMVTQAFARPMSPRMKINRRDVKSFGYNAHQYRALFGLLTVLSGVIEGIEPQILKNARGKVPMRHVNYAEDFSGIIAHWHLTPKRWDPGPGFDWHALDRALTGPAAVGVAQQP